MSKYSENVAKTQRFQLRLVGIIAEMQHYIKHKNLFIIEIPTNYTKYEGKILKKGLVYIMVLKIEIDFQNGYNNYRLNRYLGGECCNNATLESSFQVKSLA